MPGRRSLLAALAFAASGCGGPEFTKLFTTDHFEYYIEEGVDPPCDGADQWLERYYEANAKFLGATLPPGERFAYYSARSKATVRCDPGASGCAKGKEIRASIAVFPHEIAHANGYLLGHPPALFDEGLAMIVGCMMGSDNPKLLDTSDPIELLVETDAFTTWREANGFGVHGASASFVRYLIDRFGAARFLSLFAQAAVDASRPEVEALFFLTMGESLDAAFSDWRTKPPLRLGDLCLKLMECDPSMPSLIEDLGDMSPSGLAHTEVTAGCGPNTASGANPEAIRRFEIPEDHLLRVVTEPVQMGLPFVGFYRCGGGNALGSSEFTAPFRFDADNNLIVDPEQPGNAFALDVPPGAYVAWFSGASTVEARVRVDVEPRRSPMRSTCQAAEEPLPLDDKHPTTLTSRWIERPCQGPWCPGRSWDVSIGATGGALEVQGVSNSDEPSSSPAELYICSEPCPEDPSACEVLTVGPADALPTRSQQVFEPGAVLHLGAPAAVAADHFALRLRVAPE